MAQFPFPLVAPLLAIAARDDSRREPDQRQAQDEREWIAAHDRDGLGLKPEARGTSRGMRYRARPAASSASPAPVNS